MNRLETILTNLPPACLNLEGQIINKELHASAFGGSCDVYTAWSVKHRRKVAVKQIRVFMAKNRSFAKRLEKEIQIWTALKHDHVLPLLGYVVEGQRKAPSLISEWMENGTMHEYMRTFSRNSIETCTLLIGIASGLAYLHSLGIIHADLKSQNILISDNRTPLLSDFGLSLALTQSMSSGGSSSFTRGTVRWMAKELFLLPEGGSPQYNEMTDMWAFGMIVYEMLAWDVPYSEKKHDQSVILAIMRGEVPNKPEEVGDLLIFNKLWETARLCWATDPSHRPTASDVILSISDIKSGVTQAYLISVLDLQFFDTESTEKQMDICEMLLKCAWLDDPEIQMFAFGKIVYGVTHCPPLGVALVEFCHRRAFPVEFVVSSWRRPEIAYSDGWLYLHSISSLCLKTNRITEFVHRTPWHLLRHRSVFFEEFVDLLAGCR
ncbi:kinase-like protein [Schizopora paradoxa]|uniref:Kinase-like protein n=1 Tax=Schizopora paradoxa TaxID=27342 RepID=A0A0H2R610_9AGAM|nr:kinase-like protein [Schizopora paradoxa]